MGLLARWRVGDHQALIVAGVHLDDCSLLFGSGLGSTRESMAPRVDGTLLLLALTVTAFA